MGFILLVGAAFDSSGIEVFFLINLFDPFAVFIADSKEKLSGIKRQMKMLHKVVKHLDFKLQ